MKNTILLMFVLFAGVVAKAQGKRPYPMVGHDCNSHMYARGDGPFAGSSVEGGPKLDKTSPFLVSEKTLPNGDIEMVLKDSGVLHDFKTRLPNETTYKYTISLDKDKRVTKVKQQPIKTNVPEIDTSIALIEDFSYSENQCLVTRRSIQLDGQNPIVSYDHEACKKLYDLASVALAKCSKELAAFDNEIEVLTSAMDKSGQEYSPKYNNMIFSNLGISHSLKSLGQYYGLKAGTKQLSRSVARSKLSPQDVFSVCANDPYVENKLLGIQSAPKVIPGGDNKKKSDNNSDSGKQ